MVSNRSQLRKYVRFQLEQMSATNDQHRFEDLAFELARLRVATNIVRATGPVQAGGDQGRDFETFRTFLSSSGIATSAFVALATDGIVAFACTLNKQIVGKITGDLTSIFGSGVKPTHVAYFCVPDVAVAKRHDLQQQCRSTYGAELDIFDGQQIADMLCDAETFWIAEEFLSVPAEMFPPVTHDAEYARLRDRWLNPDEPRAIQNGADFLEVKRGLRRATFRPVERVDLGKWIEKIKEASIFDALRRKVDYEVAVAYLRGRGSLDPARDLVGSYFDTLGDKPDLEDIEDAAILASYCDTALTRGAFQEERSTVEGWFEKASERVEKALAQSGNRSERFRLLRLKGHLALQRLWSENSDDKAVAALLPWTEAAEIADEDPLSDASAIGDYLEPVAPILGHRTEFQALADKIDRVVAKREGAAAAGDLALRRARALADAGKLVLAIDQLQRAKEGFYAAETMRGSLLAMLQLANYYQSLFLPHAARLHAAMATYIALRSDDESMKRLAAEAGLLTAETFYQAGEGLSFLSAVRSVLPFYRSHTSDPDDLSKHDGPARAVAHSMILLTIISRIAPELESAARKIVADWDYGPEYDEVLEEASASPGWSGMSTEDVRERLREDLGHGLDEDCRDPVRISWAALGINWTVSCPKALRSIAEGLVAKMQVVQVDLADLDLVVVQSDTELEITTASQDWEVSQKPDNGRLLWQIGMKGVPDYADHAAMEEYEHRGFALTTMILRMVSTLPDTDFHELLEQRLERGLWRRAAFVRPAIQLMAEARSLAAGSELDVTALSPVQQHTPLCADELAPPTTRARTYSNEKSYEMIGNRYRRLLPFARRVASLLPTNEVAASLVRSAHESGQRDWQIITTLLNIVLNAEVEKLAGKMTSNNVDELKRTTKALGPKLMNGEMDFGLAAVTAESWARQSRIASFSFAQSWGLVIYRQTPDFGALDRLLVDRFCQHSDDIDHENVFGWPTDRTDS